jgi:hypothetical protein
MKNRAKCKLCKDILESFHATDLVYCSCGEIAINGGQYSLETWAKDYANFLRVDDEGNEIVVQYQDKIKGKDGDGEPDEEPKSLGYDELIDILQQQIDNDQKLPDHVKIAPLNTYDLIRYMILIRQIFKKIR